MSDSRTEIHRLRAQAAHAPTLAEQQAFIAQAEELTTASLMQAQASRELDLAGAIVADRLTPGTVHTLHTAATDWLGEIETAPDLQTAQHDTLARASVWYSKIAGLVKEYPEELAEQARGAARKIAGAYGEHADQIEETFLSHVGGLYQREVDSGVVKVAAGPGSTVPQVGEGDFASGVMPSGQTYEGLPASSTTSERAPQIQQLENNSGQEPHAQDVVPVNDPGLGQVDTQAERINNSGGGQNPLTTTMDAGTDRTGARTASRQGEHMPHAQCPTCGGHGRVAVRVAPQPSIEEILRNPRVAYSGLPQVDQVINNSDTNVEPTQYPTDVAFPITWTPGAQQQSIEQAEQQIAEREQRKGASRHTPSSYAQAVGQHVYETVVRTGMRQLDPRGRFEPQGRHAGLHAQADACGKHAWYSTMDTLRRQAGYDASGWAGDMGQTPYGPGEQDMPGGGGVNLGYPDPVYGEGGDNGNQPMRPYGQDEADDETNNPSTWAPGMPAQGDMGGQMNPTQAPPGGGGPAFPNPPVNQKKSSSRKDPGDTDPEIQKALQFVRQRRAYLSQAS
jgi:hypothetical protein